MNETLGMLQFFSCFVVGQIDEIVIAKINFDETVTMSNEQYCQPPWDSVFEMEQGEDITW